jgi:hypothetical protein
MVGSRVHAFAQTLKADFAGGESVYGLDKMLQGTAQPVEFPHDQSVSIAGVINGFSQASSRIDSAAGDIAEDLFAPGLLESVLLQVRILVGGGNPCIADPHAYLLVSELNPGQSF